MKEIVSIDGGTVIFMVLILAFSQLYTNKVFKVYHKLGEKITVGILSTIMAIVSIYVLMGVYFFATTFHHRH
jgi:formate/nitrite transporter FocA (FNT family)